MAALVEEHVTEITHWNDTLFSFKTTRSDSFRFANGHFVMLGLRVDGKPLLDDAATLEESGVTGETPLQVQAPQLRGSAGA